MNAEKLRNEFGERKIIPPPYEDVILLALSHYPELRETTINFILKKNHPEPYSTSPVYTDLLGTAPIRWNIYIQEEAKVPVKDVLFKNLSRDCQLGVLGHELGHIMYYLRCSRKELMRIFFLFTNVHRKRELERSADISAINHGLGQELYLYSIYIRSLKDYMRLRKDIDIYYMKPNEILQGVTEKSFGHGI